MMKSEKNSELDPDVKALLSRHRDLNKLRISIISEMRQIEERLYKVGPIAVGQDNVRPSLKHPIAGRN